MYKMFQFNIFEENSIAILNFSDFIFLKIHQKGQPKDLEFKYLE